MVNAHAAPGLSDMAATIVKETGAVVPGANAYADLDDATAYAEARPYGESNWLAASTDQKNRCLIMATLMIDNLFTFTGYRASASQSLQWPRTLAPDPDSGYNTLAIGGTRSQYFGTNIVPPVLVQATCELAMQLAISDHTGDPSNTGIKEVEVAEAIRVVFDSTTEAGAMITLLVQNMLSRLGTYRNSRGGNVKLTRA